MSYDLKLKVFFISMENVGVFDHSQENLFFFVRGKSNDKIIIPNWPSINLTPIFFISSVMQKISDRERFTLFERPEIKFESYRKMTLLVNLD